MFHQIGTVADCSDLLTENGIRRRTENADNFKFLRIVYSCCHVNRVIALVCPHIIFLCEIIGVDHELECEIKKLIICVRCLDIFSLFKCSAQSGIVGFEKLIFITESETVKRIIGHFVVFVDEDYDLIIFLGHSSRNDIILAFQKFFIAGNLTPNLAALLEHRVGHIELSQQLCRIYLINAVRRV